MGSHIDDFFEVVLAGQRLNKRLIEERVEAGVEAFFIEAKQQLEAVAAGRGESQKQAFVGAQLLGDLGAVFAGLLEVVEVDDKALDGRKVFPAPVGRMEMATDEIRQLPFEAAVLFGVHRAHHAQALDLVVEARFGLGDAQVEPFQ